jgi:hypothetical protein
MPSLKKGSRLGSVTIDAKGHKGDLEWREQITVWFQQFK